MGRQANQRVQPTFINQLLADFALGTAAQVVAGFLGKDIDCILIDGGGYMVFPKGTLSVESAASSPAQPQGSV
jgi:uncharacterized NAD-dependent epimerase/dehydratase family protein